MQRSSCTPFHHVMLQHFFFLFSRKVHTRYNYLIWLKVLNLWDNFFNCCDHRINNANGNESPIHSVVWFRVRFFCHTTHKIIYIVLCASRRKCNWTNAKSKSVYKNAIIKHEKISSSLSTHSCIHTSHWLTVTRCFSFSLR